MNTDVRISLSKLCKIGALVILLLTSSCAQHGSMPTVMADDQTSEQSPQPGLAAMPAQLQFTSDPSIQDAILSKYQHLDPLHLIDTKLLKETVIYYDLNPKDFPNRNFIAVIDFKKRSNEKRLFIIEIKSGTVWAMPVAHGKGSDEDGDGTATTFSNRPGSEASSLGVYRTAETYTGKNGLSLRLDGLSATNTNARARAIVVHGADYVRDQNVIQGRSWGCPAVPMTYRNKVISELKGGAIIYAGLSSSI